MTTRAIVQKVALATLLLGALPICAEVQLVWSLRLPTRATAFAPIDLEHAQVGHDGNGGDWAGDRIPVRRLIVLDRRPGKFLWARRYSTKHDLLIVPCRNLMEWEKGAWVDRSIDARRGKRHQRKSPLTGLEYWRASATKSSGESAAWTPNRLLQRTVKVMTLAEG